MLKDVIAVTPLEPYRMRVRFEDGVEGIVDVAAAVTFSGVFEPLRDPAQFNQAAVNPDTGAVCWPGGADLDPDVLYAAVTGQPIEFAPAIRETR